MRPSCISCRHPLGGRTVYLSVLASFIPVTALPQAVGNVSPDVADSVLFRPMSQAIVCHSARDSSNGDLTLDFIDGGTPPLTMTREIQARFDSTGGPSRLLLVASTEVSDSVVEFHSMFVDFVKSEGFSASGLARASGTADWIVRPARTPMVAEAITLASGFMVVLWERRCGRDQPTAGGDGKGMEVSEPEE